MHLGQAAAAAHYRMVERLRHAMSFGRRYGCGRQLFEPLSRGHALECTLNCLDILLPILGSLFPRCKSFITGQMLKSRLADDQTDESFFEVQRTLHQYMSTVACLKQKCGGRGAGDIESS